tara:strand:- start:1335 stop:1601 length:267 start_codon:yes stop_codon:yes gene_type:complete
MTWENKLERALNRFDGTPTEIQLARSYANAFAVEQGMNVLDLSDHNGIPITVHEVLMVPLNQDDLDISNEGDAAETILVESEDLIYIK